MLNFNRLIEGRLYRTSQQISTPYIMKTPAKGTLVTVLADNIGMTSNVMNSPYIKLYHLNRYYIERRFIEQFMGMPVRKYNNQKELFTDTFGRDHKEFKLMQTVKSVNGFNVVAELGQYNEALMASQRINRKAVLSKSEIRFDSLVKKLKDISTDFPDYKYYMYIPIDYYLEKPNDVNIWIKREALNNPVITFLRKINEVPQFFKQELPNWNFIFLNRNECFYLSCANMNEDTPEKLKKLMRKFKSTMDVIYLQDCDDSNLTDDESVNDEITVEENIKEINSYKTVTDISVAKSVTNNEIKEIVSKTVASVADKELEKVNANKGKITKSVSEDELVKEEPKKSSTEKVDLKKTVITTNNDKATDVDVKAEKEILVKKPDIELLDEKAKEEIKKELNKAVTPNRSVASLAREKKAKELNANIKVNDEVSITDLARKAESKVIDDKPVEADVINERLTNMKFQNFAKGYNKKLMDYDTMNILTSFADMDKPLYLIEVKKEDISTEMDKLYRYRCTYENELNKRVTITFDFPKFTDDRFMFLNGENCIFINQILPLPVTKVAPNQVQISSSYNKIFMTRFGRNASKKITKFLKLFSTINKNIFDYETGNNSELNIEYATSIEYDELGKKFNKIKITDLTKKNKVTTIYFNQKEIRDECESLGLTFDDEEMLPIAIVENSGSNELVCMECESGKIDYISADNTVTSDDDFENDATLIDYIIDEISKSDSAFKKKFEEAPGTKKTVYTRAKIMAKEVPVVLLLAFLDGLENLLKRLKCKFHFEEKNIKAKDNEDVFRFKDGYLFVSTKPYSNSLLLSGLHDVPTSEYDFFNFSSKDIYYQIFEIMFGRRNIGTAFENFQQLFVDSITKEILEDLNLPTDFIDLVIYANTLLENNSYDKDGDLKNYRIRSNEMVNAHLYKILSKAYESYRSSDDIKKFTIKTKALIENMYSSQVMETYSNLSPLYEIERIRATSFKGPAGCNVDRGFKIEKRAFNDSMKGILSQSSPVSSNVGISRMLTLNPNVKSLRGYLDTYDGKDQSKYDETNLLSVAEMLVPMSATHDDPQRVSMTSTQSRHTLGVMDSDCPLFGYGTDRILAKIISDKFAFKAKEDGYLFEYNEKLEYMILKYKSGKSDVVDLTNKQELNTGSGFYINNKLDPVITEPETKFKEGDIIAINRQFFMHDDITGDTIYKSGPLARVALIHGSFVYEDSTQVTERFARRMDSYVDEMKEIRLGKNSNIYSICGIGDKVRAGDALLSFDESFDDPFMNKLLDKMATDERESFEASTRQVVKSKWNGEVIDVRIYYTCPREELSESLRRVIYNNAANQNKRLKAFAAAGVNIKDIPTMNTTNDVTPLVNGKIGGTKMDEFQVLIKFFVRTVNRFGVGDKLTFGSALKGVNQSTIPLGQEPYLLSDPDEKIDAFLSIIGIYGRMVNSTNLAMALNTVLIGAKKKIKDILEDKD